MRFTAPEDVDTEFGWPLGKAERLARRGILPHYLLPDGKTIRFVRAEVEAMVSHRLPANSEVGSSEETPARMKKTGSAISRRVGISHGEAKDEG